MTDKDLVESVLFPYHELLRGIVLRARSRFVEQTVLPPACKSRSESELMWTFMNDEAKATLDRDPNVRILETAQTDYFLFSDKVLIKFKKADATGRTSNIGTEQMGMFHDPQSELPGFPKTSRVEVTYTLSSDRTSLACIQVVGRNRDKVAWRYHLEEDSQTTPFIDQHRAPDIMPAKTNANDLAPPKRTESTDEEEEKGQS